MRKQEQVDILKDLGAAHIFNSSDDTFDADIKAVIDELQPKIYFTAIGGGELPTRVLSMMPFQSTLYVYGGLVMEDCSYNPGKFIFK